MTTGETTTKSTSAGYKSSEVGKVPKEWNVKTLSEFGTFSKGKGIKRDDVTPDGVPCIRYGEIYTHHNDYVRSFNSHIPRVVAAQSKRLRKGDLLFAGSGETAEEIGKCVAYLNDEEAYAGGDIVVFSPVDQDSLYLGYLMNHPVVTAQKSRMGQGDAVVHIGARHLAQVIVPLPKKNEQSAIANSIQDIDSLIENLQKLIFKKRAMKQGAMQELLTGENRLTGFSGAWLTFKLGEVAHIKTGKKNNEDKVANGAYPFFVRSQTVERIDSYSFDGEAILVPGEGGIGTIFHYIDGRFDFHQRVYKISDFASSVSGKFVYFCMLQTFNGQAMRNSVKATVDSLRLPTFQEFEFKAPNLKEQSAIVEVLSEMEIEIDILEKKLRKTTMIRRGMVESLLTGKIRLLSK